MKTKKIIYFPPFWNKMYFGLQYQPSSGDGRKKCEKSQRVVRNKLLRSTIGERNPNLV